MARFSKVAMLNRLEARQTVLESLYGFKPGDGSITVEGRDTATIIAYGQYQEVLELTEEVHDGDIK